MGAVIKSYSNAWAGGQREGVGRQQVWLAASLKIKANGEGQGESAGKKKVEGRRETA